MPVFEYKCPSCDRKEEEYFKTHKKIKKRIKCVQCGAMMVRLFSLFKADVFPREGVYLEHVSAEGKIFYSKKEMVRYAHNNNLDLGYLG